MRSSIIKCFNKIENLLKLKPDQLSAISVYFYYRCGIYLDDDNILEKSEDKLHSLIFSVFKENLFKINFWEGSFGIPLLLAELECIDGIDNSENFLHAIRNGYKNSMPKSSGFFRGGGGCIYSLLESNSDINEVFEEVIVGVDLIEVSNQRFLADCKIRRLEEFLTRFDKGSIKVYFLHLIELCKLWSVEKKIRFGLKISSQHNLPFDFNYIVQLIIENNYVDLVSSHLLSEMILIMFLYSHEIPNNSSLLNISIDYLNRNTDEIVSTLDKSNFFNAIQLYIVLDRMLNSFDVEDLRYKLIDALSFYLDANDEDLSVNEYSTMGLLFISFSTNEKLKSWYKLCGGA